MKKDRKAENLIQSQTPSKTFDLKIVNERGLHARASAKFAALVDTFESDVEVSRGGLIVPGNSIMGLLTLAAEQGMVLTVTIVGRDAENLEKALSNLISDFFGEGK